MANRFVKRGQLLFLLSFAVLIAIGTLLLKLPGTMREGVSLRWIDAFFTATSAVCITGLTSVEIFEFSPFGQGLITLLVEVGGIGIMTLSASILLALGRGLSFSDTLLISSLNDNFSLRGSEGLTRTVIRYMLFSELCGGILIYIGMLCNGAPRWESVGAAAMVSVTSFCNAGFTPFADSMASQHRLAQTACAALNILGGLGVYVIYDLVCAWRKKGRLRLHSRIVLWGSAFLLIAGTLLFYLFALHAHDKLSWFDAFFLSATSRTAGFTTFPLRELSSGSIALVIFLMMIGTGPGSTGGGIKITTVAIAFAAIKSTISGNRDVLLFKRKMPMDNVLRAFSIIVIYTLICALAAVGMHLVYPAGSAEENLFEAVSALTTTGLSFGTPHKMNEIGKLFMIFLMYFGRLGPYTIMLFLLGREKPGRLHYPEERVVIG
ncbi:MAG: hypothetical protein MJ033_02940 [Victivallaceae bacterium]|nr:hypothetical protein [Victivallaceae bacterium]